MIAAEKKMPWLTSIAAPRDDRDLPRRSSSIASVQLQHRVRTVRRRAATCRRMMFSIMITVASTISPKSMAPTDSRLADSPRSRIRPMAKDERERDGGRHDQRARRSPRNSIAGRRSARCLRADCAARCAWSPGSGPTGRRSRSICTPGGRMPVVLIFSIQRLDPLDGRHAFARRGASARCPARCRRCRPARRCPAAAGCRFAPRPHRDPQRAAVIGGDHRVADVVQRLDQADAAHHRRLLAEIAPSARRR